MKFEKPEQKVCFAPSFGISKLPDEWKTYFKEHLLNFKSISVREQAGADIVRDLTGKEADVLIDPTLMLTMQEWEKIENQPSKVDCNKNYILTYFLGDITHDTRLYINNIAKKNNLDVYRLMDYAQPDLYVADPGEFIYLVHHAKVVLTDSFQ